MVSAVRFDRELSSLFVRRMAPVSFLCVLLPLFAHAAPFNCKTNHCGLLTKGNNPDIVIGTVERIADAKDMRRIFHWARTHGYWSYLPASEKTYLKSVKILSLSVTNPDRHSQRSITVLMAPKEFRGGDIKLGSQVRYAPRHSRHYHGPNNAAAKAYWKLIGCVAVICNAKDKTCRTRYRSGVYRHEDGRELDPATRKLVTNGVRINPVSLFIVPGTEAVHNTVPTKK